MGGPASLREAERCDGSHRANSPQVLSKSQESLPELGLSKGADFQETIGSVGGKLSGGVLGSRLASASRAFLFLSVKRLFQLPPSCYAAGREVCEGRGAELGGQG